MSGVHDIEKKLRFHGYVIFHNSTGNSRGTAILISSKLNFTVLDVFRDNTGNILLMKISVGNSTMVIGSIYGPNNDDMFFFNVLKEKILAFNCPNVVLGGDWNCTLDSRNSNINIDVLNTATIPSRLRSLWLNDFIATVNLTDPFRHFYPESREFTYVPYAENATNRSRLDFFLISNSLVDRCINCRIPNSLSTMLFDHKQVSLLFRRENPYKKQTLNDKILKDVILYDVVHITVIETYINHVIPDENFSDLQINHFKTVIGQILVNQKDVTRCRLQLAERGFDQQLEDNLTILRNSIKNNLELLPGVDVLQEMPLSCDKDVFMEIFFLTERIVYF